MWSLERHDKITYLATRRKDNMGGVITKLGRYKWHAESDDTGAEAVCPTLTKAFLWVQHQYEISQT